jgi:hypothetical protein
VCYKSPSRNLPWGVLSDFSGYSVGINHCLYIRTPAAASMLTSCTNPTRTVHPGRRPDPDTQPEAASNWGELYVSHFNLSVRIRDEPIQQLMRCCNTAILGQKDAPLRWYLHLHLKLALGFLWSTIFIYLSYFMPRLAELPAMGRVVKPRAQYQQNKMNKNSTLTTPAPPARPEEPCCVAIITTTWMSLHKIVE